MNKKSLKKNFFFIKINSGGRKRRTKQTEKQKKERDTDTGQRRHIARGKILKGQL